MNFIYIWIILALLTWFLFNTNTGRGLLKQYIPWKVLSVKRFLLMIGILSFILANPITHSIISASGLVAYWILFNSNMFFKNDDESIENNESEKIKCKISCEPLIAKQELITTRNLLKKCFYSSPYIDQNFEPNISFNGKEYSVEFVMKSYRYVSSLKEFLGHSGFKLTSFINK